MKHVLNIILLIALISSCVDSANILGVFYVPYLSHYMLGHTLMKELARRGHNVTMLSSYPSKEPIPNYTDISTEDLLDLGKELTINVAAAEKSKKEVTMINYVIELFHKAFQNKNVQNLLKDDNNTKFDLIIYDAPIGNSLLGLSHRFNAPSILFNPVGDMPLFTRYTGNYYPYSYLHSRTHFDLSTFFGRLRNVIRSFIVDVILSVQFTSKLVNDIQSKYMPDAPPFNEHYKNISLLLTNTHFTYETPRPYTPNVIQIGGFNLIEQKPIQKDLKNWLDTAEDGVILVSYGSGITGFVFDDKKTRLFLNVFSKLKQRILWKFDINEVKNKTNIKQLPDNIKFENWIPQKEVLNHPNVKLFITHVGMGALSEAVYGGVPMIGTPFFSDQETNVNNMAKNYGYGIEIDFVSLTESILEGAINEVLYNPKYSQRIKKASKLFKNQPLCPMEKAMYWIEHVIKYKGAVHLKPESKFISDYQHQLLDVVTFLFIINALMLYISFRVIKKIVKCILKRK